MLCNHGQLNWIPAFAVSVSVFSSFILTWSNYTLTNKTIITRTTRTYILNIFHCNFSCLFRIFVILTPCTFIQPFPSAKSTQQSNKVSGQCQNVFGEANTAEKLLSRKGRQQNGEELLLFLYFKRKKKERGGFDAVVRGWIHKQRLTQRSENSVFINDKCTLTFVLNICLLTATLKLPAGHKYSSCVICMKLNACEMLHLELSQTFGHWDDGHKSPITVTWEDVLSVKVQMKKKYVVNLKQTLYVKKRKQQSTFLDPECLTNQC